MNETLVQPPHSEEAEQSVIGAILLANGSFDEVSWLSAQDFYSDRHRRLWACVGGMLEAGRAADTLTVCEELGRLGDLDKAGGPAYIAGLTQNTPSARNVRRYAEVVDSRAVQRRLYQVGMEIAEAGLTPGPREIGQLLDEAESKIFALSERDRGRGEGPLELTPLLSKVFERIDHLHSQDNPSEITGVPSGFSDLDHLTSGLQPSDLIIVAGRPSMGKTALALNIAEHVAVKHRLPVVVFSMEMSATQVTQRLLGSIARVDHHKLRTGRLSDDEWPRLTETMATLSEAPMHIDDGSALTALEVRARARRVKRQHGKLGLVVVDYLQLMQSRSQGEHRAGEIAEISRSLKALAKELECPVIALSQLSREVEKRPTRRPMMSDLRESGAIEQDADVILFIYREEVYNADCREEDKGVAEVIIGKQRNGPVGMVRLTFLGRFTRFENYAPPEGGDYAPRMPRTRRNFYDVKSQAAGDRGE